MLNKKGLKIVTIIIAVLLIVAMVIPLVMTAYTFNIPLIAGYGNIILYNYSVWNYCAYVL